MVVRWITKNLGTAPWSRELELEQRHLVDVRNLRDSAGNSSEEILSKIKATCELLSAGEKVVVCCDLGISRSNTIAAAALATTSGISLNKGLLTVINETKESSIKLDFVENVREAMSENKPIKKNKNKILVIGNESFIVKSLKSSLNSCQIEPKKYDLTIKNSILLNIFFDENSINSIVYCANSLTLGRSSLLDDEINTLRNILDVCQVQKSYFIFISGKQVFDGIFRKKKTKINETTLPSPNEILGDILFLSEMLIQQYKVRYNIPILIVRSVSIYGSGDHRPWLLNRFISNAINNKEIITHQYENGNPKIDLIHVSDFVKAIHNSIIRNLTGHLHIASENLIETRDLAKLVIKIFKSKSENGNMKIPSSYSKAYLASKIISREIDWEPKVKLDDWLKQHFQSITENIN